MLILLVSELLPTSALDQQPPSTPFRLEQLSSNRPPVPKTSANLALYYPTAAQREQREGNSRFTVHVSPSGQVTSCEIAISSGYADLDEATCRFAMTIKFQPATGGSGQPVEGAYSQLLKWRIRDPQTVPMTAKAGGQ